MFLHTNPFKEERQYFNHKFLSLLSGTSATNKLISVSLQGLEGIYRSGYEYKRVGVLLQHLSPDGTQQFNFFEKSDVFKEQ